MKTRYLLIALACLFPMGTAKAQPQNNPCALPPAYNSFDADAKAAADGLTQACELINRAKHADKQAEQKAQDKAAAKKPNNPDVAEEEPREDNKGAESGPAVSLNSLVPEIPVYSNMELASDESKLDALRAWLKKEEKQCPNMVYKIRGVIKTKKYSDAQELAYLRNFNDGMRDYPRCN